jgi:hypothetical protein
MRGTRPVDPSPGGWFTVQVDAWPKGRLGQGHERSRTAEIGHDVESRFDTDRAEAFSDGVFGIAITLLVLELSVPEE